MKRTKTFIIAALFVFVCLLTACSISEEEAGTVLKNARTSVDYSKYENVNVFEEAKKYGYKVTELESFSHYYALFSINDSSILLASEYSSGGNIGLFNCILTRTDIGSGRFAYFSTFYSDRKADSRNEYGRWSITNEHKHELLTLLKDYSEIGVRAFAALFPDASQYMDETYRSLIKEHNLIARYQNIDNRYYRIIFFDDTGKSAWYVAEYTEADIEKSQYAFGLNTWEGYSGDIGGVIGSRFPRDLIKKDGLLYSSESRISELNSFFNGK